MKISSGLKASIATSISFLYIVLFTYAAAAKLIDYENFTVQLGQSPLLSAFAGWIAWLISAIELLLVVLLAIDRTRQFALLAAFALMAMFSTYIYVMLNYSDFVPCSCGGILEKLSWEEHLAFNVCFCVLAIIGFVCSLGQRKEKSRVSRVLNILLLYLTLSFLASALVVILFLQSEKIIHQANNFIRRFPPHLYDKYAERDLQYAGYYFAGADSTTVYLGNYTAPLSILAVDTTLHVVGKYRIQLDDYNLPFRSAQVRVASPYFYLTDGTVPCIFSGKITDWKAHKTAGIGTYFSAIEPVDSTMLVFRGKSRKTGENILGTLSLDAPGAKVIYGDALLQKQIDGIFDTDGMLHYNRNLQRLLYLYYYRNQFIVAGKQMQLSYRGYTIDTTTRAKLRITNLKNGDRKLSAPPAVTNKFSATFGNELFINSNLRGRYESDVQWKETAIVDVYDLAKNSYRYSLPIYPVNKKKLHAILATKTRLYFLIDNAIVAYHIKKENQPRNLRQ
jgi:uncharacterized membrane protein YphA (DoxX/SURF4 family)